MKKLMFAILLVAGFFVSAQESVEWELQDLKPQPEHPEEAKMIVQYLANLHYVKLQFDDSISSRVFDKLFLDLDPSKAYFLDKELAAYEKYRYLLDDQLQQGNLSVGFEVFEIYRKNALQQIKYVYKLLDNEFDFGQEEYFDIDRQLDPWPKTDKERNEVWRKIIKNQALAYKLAGRDWEDISNALTQRYKRVEKALYQYTSEDVFQVYMNALSTSYDPHTNYFSPMDAEDFEIDMSLSLEGIGARLSQQLDYTVVSDIVPGGPAYQGKELEVNDKIIGVAQGDNSPFEDVIGWRINEVVRKIRGPKGTVVRLQVLKQSKGINALPDTIRIVRDKIKLEEQEAKAEVIPISENGKSYNLGVITIPSFYINFEERARGIKDFKSTTRDVRNLITELTDKGIDALMIDLRYNGGGSLDEAIDLTGLFIPQGPVVQVRDMRDRVEKLYDTDGGSVLYDGPLAVLVNRYSASASEIFSGAIQDYKRGVVFGENSFGKGTVQNLVDLGPNFERQIGRMISAYQQMGDLNAANELKELRTYMSTNKVDLGQLKLTVAKFYRVTGRSTQRLGVSPDVHFPTPYSPDEMGESQLENALQWDEILGADFRPSNKINQEIIDQLNRSYREHLNSDKDLLKLVKDVERRKTVLANTQVSLNLESRRDDQNVDDELEEELEPGDFQNEDPKEKLSKDPYLKEGLRLLAELTRRSIG